MKPNTPQDERARAKDRHRLVEFFRDELRRAAVEEPSFDELAAYVEGRLGPEERAELEERLAAEPELRREADDLRELSDQMRRPRALTTSKRARPMALAGLGAAAAVAAVVLWVRSERPPASGGGARVAPSPAPIAMLKDGAWRPALSASGAVSGLPALDPGVRDAVAGALRGRLPAPQGLESLRSGPVALMGGIPDATFAPLGPLGTRVADERPTLRWAPLRGARSYEAAVFDTELRRVAASGAIAGTEWRPERALPRGRTYLWQVSASTAAGRVTVPSPPAPEARFEIAGSRVLAEVERRRAAAPGSHLVATLALIEAGLLDDAEAELRALAAENPGSPEVARLSASLEDLRRAR
jgi:hypothetical protein